MRRKPSRPSRKKSPRAPKFAKGPPLAKVLRRHPEVQMVLRTLHLRIEVSSGRLLGRALWPCPQPPLS